MTRAPMGMLGPIVKTSDGVLLSDKLKALRTLDLAERDQRFADAWAAAGDVRKMSAREYELFKKSIGVSYSRVLPRR